uniref:BZIP domain-containing protein n=1 Tax=Strongyloides papillosus TaxID=174720 RepID=A0A0N5BR48_STREA
MKSIKLVIVFILLINILLTESFESKNDLVSNNIKSIDNLQQPAILNDEEDTNSIEKRQSRSKKSKAKKRKNKRRRIQQVKNALTQLQSQIASIATRLDSLTTTVRPDGRR